MNTNSPPVHVFGTPYIHDIIPSESGSTVKVKIFQVVQTTYPPGSREQFALQDSLTPGKEKTVVSTRKITQRLSPEQAKDLTVGQEIEGHIARTLRSTPRYPDQKPAYEGGYASASWHTDYTPDVDERELATA
jgi:hypothetical protein